MKKFFRAWKHNFKTFHRQGAIIVTTVTLFRLTKGNQTDVLKQMFEVGDLFSVSLAILIGIFVDTMVITATVSALFGIMERNEFGDDRSIEDEDK